MLLSVEETVRTIEQKLRDEFADVEMEFTRQMFANHVELWVYVLKLSAYDSVVERCDRITEEYGLDRQSPEIWLLPKTWTGPWPGGESEQMLRNRRDEFKIRNSPR